MEGNKEEESLLEVEDTKKPQKGGLKTIPFIIVNDSFERLASLGLMPNMILYLMQVYHMEAATASIILFIWSALSNGLALVGAFLSDSYLGRFKVIVLGSIFSLLGMILLWMTAIVPELKPPSCDQLTHQCSGSTVFPIYVLVLSFLLVSMGAGCIRPCSIAFGADQLDKKENPNNERVLQSYFNWYYASTGISSLLAVTVIVYIQDNFGWKVGFGIPALLVFLSTLMLLVGSSLYIKTQVSESLFAGFGQVLVAAFRKRKADQSLTTNNYHYETPESVAPSEKLRCLNKACIIQDPERELNSDGSVSNNWILCSVEQVESTKVLFTVVPMWSTGLLVFMSITAGNFATLQAKCMDRHLTSNFEIPAGSFNLFMILTITIWVAVYDRILAPRISAYTGQPKGLSPVVRMGTGLIIVCIGMVVSAVVEGMRRNKAIEQGVQDDPNSVVNMSAFWLVPQYMLYGLAEAFNAIGQIEFFYSQFPRTMSSIAVAIFTFGMAISSLLGSVLVKSVDTITSHGDAPSWLSSNLNQGHLDYYYWLLTALNLINFVYFLFCWRSYISNNRWTILPPEVSAAEPQSS